MKNLAFLLNLFLVFLVAMPAFAGGFQLSDHSIAALGRSQAGFGVVGDDASAAYFNPAGMSLLSQRQLQNGVAFNRSVAPYSDKGSTGANVGGEHDGAKDSLVPHGYFILPLAERWRFGLAVNSPFSTNSHYEDDFIGRFNGLQTRIKTINLNPSISYRVNDVLSLGAGLSYQHFETVLSSAISPLWPGSKLTIEGDDRSWGYNVGAMFQFADESRLGLSYRSKIVHDLRGDATFSGAAVGNGRFAAQADFVSPETIYFAYTRPLADKWRLSLGYRWTRWSRFRQLHVAYPDATLSQSTTIAMRWHDSGTTSIGLDYELSPRWTLRGGVALDQSPVPDDTRSVRTVDADRTWYSIGASWHLSERLQLDFAYRYIDFDLAKVNQNIIRSGGSIGSLVGSYDDIDVHTFAIQANYRF